MPRMVIPDGLMESSSPQSFSLGVCKLTTTIECGSIGFVNNRLTQFRVFVRRSPKQHEGRMTPTWPGVFREASFGNGLANMQKHNDKACQHHQQCGPAKRVGQIAFARIHWMAIRKIATEQKACQQTAEMAPVVGAQARQKQSDRENRNDPRN